MSASNVAAVLVRLLGAPPRGHEMLRAPRHRGVLYSVTLSTYRKADGTEGSRQVGLGMSRAIFRAHRRDAMRAAIRNDQKAAA